jgi:hypothetical protein
VHTKSNGTLALAVVGLGLLVACNKDAEFRGNNAEAVAPVVLAEQEFPAARIEDDSLTYKPAFGLVEQTVKLRQKPPRARSWQQIERALFKEPFDQGHDGNPADQSFPVSDLGKLDLLVVVDNSDSMKDEQDKLKDKLPALTKHLKSTDWRIAVVTTDSSCLRLGRVINKSDADADDAFRQAIAAGTGGSGNERGIGMANQAFEGYCEEQAEDVKWWRDDSSLAVLFVSDEESYCAGLGCPAGSEYSPETFVATMRSLRSDASMLRAYALIWDSTNSACDNSNGASTGRRYKAVVNDPDIGLGGLVGSICEADYTHTLEAISQDVARTVQKDFDLDMTPVDGSVVATVDGQPFTDYQLTGKHVHVGTIDDEAKALRITYRYGPVPKFDHVTISGDPAPGSVRPYVNDALLAKDAYEWDEATKTVTFDEMPADKAKVVIKYRGAGELPATFDLSNAEMDGGLLTATINGESAEFTWDEIEKAITFPEPPEDGAQVQVTFRAPGNRVTRYDVGVTDLTQVRNGVTAKDPASGVPLSLSIDGDQLVFDEADVVDGRAVTVIYDYAGADDVLTHEIGHEPLPDTLKVTRADGTTACLEGVVLKGRQVSFQCEGEDAALGDVTIAYKYLAELHTSFAVDVAIPAGATTKWDVFVDGQLVVSTRDGNIVTVDAALLTPASKVKVVVSKI